MLQALGTLGAKLSQMLEFLTYHDISNTESNIHLNDWPLINIQNITIVETFLSQKGKSKHTNHYLTTIRYIKQKNLISKQFPENFVCLNCC